MDSCQFILFDTPIGSCGVAWTPRGVVGVQLPEASAQATRARLQRRFPDATSATAPPAVAQAIADIVALLSGTAVNLGAIVLDDAGLPPFHRRVYAVARSIAPGTTLSYGEVAARLGEPHEARAVGRALGSNPFAIIVPCHRVLAAGGAIGGFSATGGAAAKRKILSIERARIGNAPDLFAVDAVTLGTPHRAAEIKNITHRSLDQPSP